MNELAEERVWNLMKKHEKIIEELEKYVWEVYDTHINSDNREDMMLIAELRGVLYKIDELKLSVAYSPRGIE